MRDQQNAALVEAFNRLDSSTRETILRFVEYQAAQVKGPSLRLVVGGYNPKGGGGLRNSSS